jgi:hypothetical protein
MFDATVRRLGLGHRNRRDDGQLLEAEGDVDEPTTFQRPPRPGAQLSLF